MKKIQLTKREAYDLAAVLSTSLREKAETIDFKDIIGVQKVVNLLLAPIKDYSDRFEDLNKQRKSFVDSANDKIAIYRRKLADEVEKGDKLPEDYKESVNNYVQDMLTDAQKEIEENVAPEFTKFYNELGKETVEIEIEDGKHKMTLGIFEKFAKTYYSDKKAMVETYEKFTV